MCEYRIKWIYKFIPEQFTAIGPALFEGEGQKKWSKKMEAHFREDSAWGVFVRSFRPEKFLSVGDFGLGGNLRNVESIQILFISDNAFVLNLKKHR